VQVGGTTKLDSAAWRGNTDNGSSSLKVCCGKTPMSREDWNLLLRTAAEAAISFLEKGGDFLPFAFAIDSQGGLSLVAVDFRDDGTELIEQLRAALKGQAAQGRYRGVAVANDVEIVDPTTQKQTKAIRVELEHRDLEPITWYLPYRRARGEFQYGDANGEGIMQEGERIIFPV
jgi:hypothetical protein